MREMVSERVEKLSATHARTKEGKYGYLVRPLTLVLGWTILIIGLITIPLPGQGWLTTFVGVGILSLEQKWAHNLLSKGVHLYDRFFAWFHRQSATSRVTMVIALIIVIWVVFITVFMIAWSNGMINVADSFMAEIGFGR
ncbi:putative TIGR02611 family protein [Corynebacterium testudinoris]|uniref:Putative TIGR02611 family protein n=2 Tax=Corynebacterium testudinoris TaxID=136857 RepID=A0A0G3H3D9_9CORY|nr:putative TIGR02611 family protein [Corynebacterium testudinoris]